MSHYKPNPDKSVNLTIDGIPVTVPEGTRILEAARKVNVNIPVLCDHPDLCKRAICRICMVECDGRVKTACGNDVWEGVNVITHNSRLINIRKTILELILANHPQECLNCIRNKNCELQKLAADLNIRETPFSHDAVDPRPALTEQKTLVRDMGKCVKCGRCVEVCQEVQTIRNINTCHRSIHYEIGVPYGQSLADGPCVFCGQCAAVCPVGAIYEYDQSAEAWAALNDTERHVAVQISPACAAALAAALTAALDGALGLPASAVSPGKMVSALKRLGFDRVFNAASFAAAAKAAEHSEVLNRVKNSKDAQSKLPMITGCSSGWIKFAENFYPDLKEHFSPCKSPRQTFNALIKTAYSQAAGIDPARIVSVSVSPCIAGKYIHGSAPDVDLALSVNELARMIRLGGIDLAGLPETPFDVLADTAVAEAAPDAANCGETQAGIQETEITIDGTVIKTLTAHGFANARIIMDSIRKGECGAAVVHIKSCPGRR